MTDAVPWVTGWRARSSVTMGQFYGMPDSAGYTCSTCAPPLPRRTPRSTEQGPLCRKASDSVPAHLPANPHTMGHRAPHEPGALPPASLKHRPSFEQWAPPPPGGRFRTAPVITVFIPGTSLKTTPLQTRARSIQKCETRVLRLFLVPKIQPGCPKLFLIHYCSPHEW